MTLDRTSSAPHLYPAAQWEQHLADQNECFLLRDAHAKIAGLVLHRSADGAVEVGIRRWAAGTAPFAAPADMLCHFTCGRAVFRSQSGETLEVAPGTVVHFKQGWRGHAEVAGPLDATYMVCAGGPAERTPLLHDAMTASPLKDWGPIPTMLEGTSHTAGILLGRETNGRAESGIWTCTPGVWRCEVTHDEFCHFLEGSCTYTHDGGDRIEIQPDTLAFFPQGWAGRCQVHRTVRKVYMIR